MRQSGRSKKVCEVREVAQFLVYLGMKTRVIVQPLWRAGGAFVGIADGSSLGTPHL